MHRHTTSIIERGAREGKEAGGESLASGAEHAVGLSLVSADRHQTRLLRVALVPCELRLLPVEFRILGHLSMRY